MDLVQNLKSQVSIVDVVARYRPLVKAGKNFKALCPFHDDHKPSMVVNPVQNFAWCFACQNGGDIFSFVQKIEGVEFVDAVKILGEIGGVDTSSFQTKSRAQVQKIQEKKEYSEQLRDVLLATQEFFLDQFTKNSDAQEYIKNTRKFSEETISSFGIGYAPDSFNDLEKFLLEKKFSRKQMLDSGVMTTKDEMGESVYDKFRGRIMFPVYDALGKICGFGGRILETQAPQKIEQAKYMNSPQTQLYDKSQLLFGFEKAKTAMRKENMAVLVEGNLDVMTCHEFGITNAVGVSGIGFSPAQAKILKRFCTRVTLALDNDEAGMRASERIIEVLFAHGFSVQMMVIPEGKDPDESLRDDSQKFIEALADAPSGIESMLTYFLRIINTNNAEGKRQVFEKIFPLIQKIKGRIEQEESLAVTSELLQVDIILLEHEYRLFLSQHASYNTQSKVKVSHVSSLTPSEYFFGTLFSFPQYSQEFFSVMEEEFFLSSVEKNLYSTLQSAYTSGMKFCSDTILDPCDPSTRENIKKASLYAQEKLSLLPSAQQRTEVQRMVQSMGKTLLRSGIKQCTDALRTAPTPQAIEHLQFLTTSLRRFH